MNNQSAKRVNIVSLKLVRELVAAQMRKQNQMEKLASGQRINRAADDAAGLSISEKMRGQIRGLDQAAKMHNMGYLIFKLVKGL